MWYLICYGAGIASTVSAKLAWDRYGAPALAKLKAKLMD